MSVPPPPLPPDVRVARGRALAWGLTLAFLPVIMVMLVTNGLAYAGVKDSETLDHWLELSACFFTVGCSVASACILFRRFNTGVILAVVVMLLLINGCIALFLGCAALMTG